jgi:plastocyanin
MPRSPRIRLAAIAPVAFLLAASACTLDPVPVTGAGPSAVPTESPAALTTLTPSSTPGASAPAPSPTATPFPLASRTPDGLPDGTVHIRDFAFEPSSITIDQGDSLVFRNRDFQAHTVVPLLDGDFIPPDTIPAQRESEPVLFDRPGTIHYGCGIHPDETGVVRVRDTGAPDATPTPEAPEESIDPDASPTPTPTPVPTPQPTPTPVPVAGTVATVITSTAFDTPEGIALDADGNFYVADSGHNKIFKVRSDGVITLLAGSGAFGFADGPAQTAAFRAPRDLAVDTHGYVYVADTLNHRIRRIDTNLSPSDAAYVITLAGGKTPGSSDGVGPGALFREPTGLSVDSLGTLFVADSGNHKIRAMHPNGNVVTLGGTGVAGV